MLFIVGVWASCFVGMKKKKMGLGLSFRIRLDNGPNIGRFYYAKGPIQEKKFHIYPQE